jgi:GNAT superfamily N-acetyltransferase
MKQPIKIETFEQYSQLVECFNRKGRLTNDYLQNQAADLIIHDSLFAICGEDNAALLVQKDGFQRLYYYINNPEEHIVLPQGEYVTEILFRGEKAPEVEVKYLEGMGFTKNLIRDQYFAKYASLTPPLLNSGLKIELATLVDDALWAINLFNVSFDKWSGDFISQAEASLLIQNRALLIAKDIKGNRLGALHLETVKGVTWLNHVAVVEKARGMGVGRGLVEAYIEQGHMDENSRYMLWVQRQNTPAVYLYKNKGFIPMNKSTLSMIKL